MNRPHVTFTATQQALHLLCTLSYLGAAIDTGGQVSELHLNSLMEGTLALLDTLGGFEEIVAQHLHLLTAP